MADDKIGTIANTEGKYRLDNIPNGHHVVEVSYSGYSTLVVHLELNSSVEKDFALSSVIVENLGVVVKLYYKHLLPISLMP